MCFNNRRTGRLTSMADTTYQVVFNGSLLQDAEPARVREGLARLFKIDAGRVQALFDSAPVVIKAGLDQATASKYRAAMRTVGAQCELRPEADAIPIEAPACAEASVAEIPEFTLAPVGTVLVAFGHVASPAYDLSAYSLAEPGTTLSVQAPPDAPDIDTSQMDLSPVGADLRQ